jgi:hypothetical protein
VDTAKNHVEISKHGHMSNRICRKCRKIDFEAIFNEDRRDRRLYKIWGERQINVSHISPERSCTLCQFFYSTREPPLDKNMVHQGYYLSVCPVKSALGAWKLQFDDSPGFRVIPIQDIRKMGNSNHGMTMELSEAQESFYGHQVQPEVDLSIINGWLSFCDNHHKTMCKQKSAPPVPTGFRVIDCTTRKIVPWEEIANQNQYVTLSYVWGKSTHDVILHEGIIPQLVPRTIEDTILLTKKLGYRYLWIDCYCISQGDKTNRQTQIQSMDIIYERSVLIVVAAAGIDPDHGLPGVGAVLRKRQPSVKIGNRTLVYAPFAKEQILTSKWNSRGWTYQEGLLSRRKLVFTTTQVYFQCNAMHCLESIRGPLEFLHTCKNVRMGVDIDMSRVFPHGGLGRSRFDVEDQLNEYLKRSLTSESDIQDAFKDILAAFERKFPGQIWSLCGIPIFSSVLRSSGSEAFVMGLAWSSSKSTSKNDLYLKRRKSFPSWTWLGWDSNKVIFRCAFDKKDENYTGHKTVAHASMEYADGVVLPWSEAMSTILTRDKLALIPVVLHLHGPTFEIYISTDGTIIGDDEGGVIENIRVYRSEGQHLKFLVRTMRTVYPSSSKQTADCLLKFTLMVSHQWAHKAYILVLYQPEGSSCFERVDCYSISSYSYDSTKSLRFPLALKDWAQRNVRIG